MRSRISKRGYVRPSVHPSIHPLVRRSVTHKLKPCKSAVFDQNYYQYDRERVLYRVSGHVLLIETGEFLNDLLTFSSYYMIPRSTVMMTGFVAIVIISFSLITSSYVNFLGTVQKATFEEYLDRCVNQFLWVSNSSPMFIEYTVISNHNNGKAGCQGYGICMTIKLIQGARWSTLWILSECQMSNWLPAPYIFWKSKWTLPWFHFLIEVTTWWFLSVVGLQMVTVS